MAFALREIRNRTTIAHLNLPHKSWASTEWLRSPGSLK
jgi:hypothetical protein